MAMQVLGLDSEHHAILLQLEKVEEAFRAADLDHGDAELAVLSTMVDQHFASEESWLREGGFNRISGHLACHNAIRKELAMVRQGVILGPLPDEALMLLDALKDLIFRHLVVEDMEIKWFALEHGLADHEADDTAA